MRNRTVESSVERAVRQVAEKDRDGFRRDAYAALVRQRRAVALIDRIAAALPRRLRGSLAMAYGLAAGITTRLAAGSGDVVCAAKYRNEQRQFDHLQSLVPELSFESLQLGVAAALHRDSLEAGVRLLTHRQSRQLLAQAAHHDDELHVSCRAAETVARWLRLTEQLPASGARAVLVSSDTNPHACALMAAAEDAGLPVVFVNHGHLPPGVPRMTTDLAILDGEALREVYAASGPIEGRVVYRGCEGVYRPMDTAGLRRSRVTLGIFGSLIMDWPRFGALVDRLRERLQPRRILLRLHPNQTMRAPDWRDHVRLSPSDHVSEGERVLLEDAAECDLVVAGSSSCHLTVLKHGVPALSLRGLDAQPHDYYGFVRDRVVIEADAPESVELDAVARFYDDPEWAARFRRYDASYPDREAQCAREVAEALRAVVR